MNYVKAVRAFPRFSGAYVERVAIKYSVGPVNTDSSGDSSDRATLRSLLPFSPNQARFDILHDATFERCLLLWPCYSRPSIQ